MALATGRIPTSRPGSWFAALRRMWTRSLRFRTTLLTGALSALAIAIACISMALAIHNELFGSRLTQVLEQAQRGVEGAQEVLDDADYASDSAGLQSLIIQAREQLRTQAGTTYLSYSRISDDPSSIAPPDLAFALADSDDLVSDGLAEQVRGSADGQWWQSIALRTDARSAAVPAIVVGQQLDVQGAGPYEVYLIYSLQDTDETLRFVQGTLWITGLVLVVLVALISWLVLRSVTRPIIETSQTSARFAAGELDVRVPVRGEDEIASLGRSFNGMADSIESQITELAELSQVQQRFVSDVSHELRTPLTTIRLASEMLADQREDFDELTARTTELLHTQVGRFEQLLTDLLEISRYDAGSVQLELEPTPLAALAEDVVASMAPIAANHGTALRLITPGGHSPVDVDPRRIRRILRNLIGNAIEHGEGKPIVITVDSDGQAAAVAVRDFGIGMTAEQAEHVFDRFWRADPSRKRTLGGTGLGLAIALGDAKLHGGTLEVWSKPGEGANFVLSIPRGEGDGRVHSPIALEPRDALADLPITQPIDIITPEVEIAVQPDDEGEETS
ncbi:MAG: MtrAB system histidine kinase MtrB [Microbacterium sp.]